MYLITPSSGNGLVNLVGWNYYAPLISIVSSYGTISFAFVLQRTYNLIF